jgi:hypothetical protein
MALPATWQQRARSRSRRDQEDWGLGASVVRRREPVARRGRGRRNRIRCANRKARGGSPATVRGPRQLSAPVIGLARNCTQQKQWMPRNILNKNKWEAGSNDLPVTGMPFVPSSHVCLPVACVKYRVLVIYNSCM